MKRIWQIEEQVVEDPSSKLRLEFSSVHSDELQVGNEAPDNDHILTLTLWSSQRDRKAIIQFTRNGRFISTQVEPVMAAEPGDAPPDLPARDLADLPREL